MHSEIELLASDIFGAPVSYDIAEGERQIADFINRTQRETVAMLDEAGRLEFAWGGIDANTFLERFTKVSRWPFSMQDIESLWTVTYRVNLPVWDEFKCLEDSGCALLFVSNHNEIDAKWARHHCPILPDANEKYAKLARHECPGLRDGRIICSNPGSDVWLKFKKPEPLIYKLLAARARYLGVTSLNQILVVDNTQENVDAARQIGFPAELVIDKPTLVAVLQQYGLKS